MVNSCSAVNCVNRYTKSKNGNGKEEISFHRFPLNNKEMLKKWVCALRRDKFKPTKYSFVCSDHFSEDCFIQSGWATRRRLREDAVPTLFDFPSHIGLKKSKPRRQNKLSASKDALSTSAGSPQNSTCTVSEMAEGPTVPENDVTVLNKTPVTQLDSPRKKKLKRKVKTLQQKLRRRSKTIKNMKQLIEHLKASKNDYKEVAVILEQYFDGFPLHLLLHQLKNNSKKKHALRYSSDMKEFALTLYFYSPKAYRYVRTLFHLPHPSQIRSWVSSVKCEPGFLSESFAYLKSELAKNPKRKDCTLTFDSMAIRKQIQFDVKSQKYSGYVDCGGIVGGDDVLATEALVFMLVGIGCSFKCPVAYFFVDKINSNVQAQLINIAIRKLNEIGISVWSITCDGAQSNFATLQLLGCNFSVDNFRPYFTINSNKVHAVFDPCHMIKLARNCLADKKSVAVRERSDKMDLIKLQELQDEIGLRFANNLTSCHINFQNKKMNVRLAVQCLSSGVADALEFLLKSGHEDFIGCEASIEFFRKLDRIFDVLNSRSPFGKGFKQPLFLGNIHYWMEILNDTEIYLKTLRIDNIPISQHPRKMFVIGFLVAIEATRNVAIALLQRAENPLKYLLTYKFSQDHVELFFSCIRSHGGHNNNPSSLQFQWTLRKLLMKNHVVSSESGNCSYIEDSPINPIFNFHVRKNEETDIDNLPDKQSFVINFLESESLNMYTENILYYITGYLVRNMLKTIKCADCPHLLIKETSNEHNYASCSAGLFTAQVNRGNLIFPSDDAFAVVKNAEKIFQSLKNSTLLMRTDNLLKKIVHSVVASLSDTIRPFSSHPIVNELICEDLHETSLVKKLSFMYAKLRLLSYGKTHNLEKALNNRCSVRSKLHKLILFNNV